MRPLGWLVRLCLALAPGSACLVAAEANPQTAPAPAAALPSLADVRAAGRLKSAYLKGAPAAGAQLANSAQLTNSAQLASSAQTADLDGFTARIAPVFKSTCITCHGPEKQKGKFRVDTLDPDLLKGGDVAKWLKVSDVLGNGEMPPENDRGIHLDDGPRAAMVAWLGTELQKASQAQRSAQRATSFRRMARYEYNYALQDLLGLPYDFVDDLPPEAVSEDGFKNSSPMLQMSGMQLDAYRQIALVALKKATVSGARPPLVTYQIPMEEALAVATRMKSREVDTKGKDHPKDIQQAHVIDRATGKGFIYGYSYQGGQWGHKPDAAPGADPAPSPVVAVIPHGAKLMLDLGDFLPAAGTMRVRLRAARSLRGDESVGLRLIFGCQTSNNANSSRIVSAADLPVTADPDHPQMLEFRVPLGEIPRNPFRRVAKLGETPNPAEVLSIQHIGPGRGGDEPLDLLVDYVEITAPYYEQWPPRTHTDIFPAGAAPDETAHARAVLETFMSHAWRRPVRRPEVERYLALFADYRPGFATFEDAMVEVLATALASPEFLYLTQAHPDGAGRGDGADQRDGADQGDGADKAAQKIDQFALASRLSMFLWCSIPDRELLDLAQQGRLRYPKTLAAQVERLLADPRAQRFAQNFVHEWLGLDALDHVTIDKQQYRSFDADLKEAMRQEPLAFFAEVLAQNASIMDFIHADYVVINERLAQHYQIGGVRGPAFRKVAVDAASHRGGILTDAGLLAMNSDGKDSHPLKRGVWMLKRILGDPPPPPPADVPQVDLTNPDVLKMTIKERIADHRNKPACISCHARIDPWGIALENYDAVGAYRTRIKDQPVDAKSALFNQQVLDGVDGLERYLLADRQDQFAKAIVHKLAAYALGRTLGFSDRADLDKVTARFRTGGDHLRDLITMIVTSDLFQVE